MFSVVYPQLGVLFLLVSDRNIRSVGLGYPHWRKEDVLCLSQSAKQGFAGLGNGEHCNGSILSTLSPVRSLAQDEKRRKEMQFLRETSTHPQLVPLPLHCAPAPLCPSAEGLISFHCTPRFRLVPAALGLLHI